MLNPLQPTFTRGFPATSAGEEARAINIVRATTCTRYTLIVNGEINRYSQKGTIWEIVTTIITIL